MCDGSVGQRQAPDSGDALADRLGIDDTGGGEKGLLPLNAQLLRAGSKRQTSYCRYE